MPCPTQARQDKKGFTVAEVLMAVLLLAAVLGLVIANYFSFDGALDKRPVEVQVRLAVADAHRLARTHRESIYLRYDAETKQLNLSNDLGKYMGSYAFPTDVDITVTFFRTIPESQFEEEPSFEAEEHSTDVIRFLPYGPSAPFIVELDQSSELTELRFDAFSSMNWKKTDAI